MAVQLSPLAVQRFYDNNNNPLAGGQLFTYQAGTTTPVATYTDSTSTTSNPNPVILNARGEAPVWLLPSQAYKFVLCDANGNTIWTCDHITSPAPVAVGNMTDEKGSGGTIGFASGVDFTGGSTTSLTLSQSYGSASNIWVDFDGAAQASDSFTLNGTTLTFLAPIPVGVNKVYVKGGTTLTTSSPSTSAVFSQASTGQFWAQNGAQINRMNDRVLVGGMTASDASYPPVSMDWFMQYEKSVGYTNPTLSGVLCVSTSPSPTAQESVASTFAAQSLTATSPYASCIPIEAFAINNNLSYGTSAWAFYGEAHKTTTQSGSVYGMELDVLTVVSGGSPNPYQQGTSIGIQLGVGAGVKGATFTGNISGTTLTVVSGYVPEVGYSPAIGDSVFGVGVTAGTVIVSIVTNGTYTVNNSQTVSAEYMVLASQQDAAAAIQIVSNPTRWGVGINFLSTSLVGCDGTNGVGIAMALAKGHALQWYTPGGYTSASIKSTIANSTNLTGINFSDSGMQVFGPGAVPLAYFTPIASAANYLSFNAATTGNSPIIQAGGTDTNINLALLPKGTGSIQLGASYTAGAVSQTGYVMMLDASGTPRRFLIG